MIINTKQLCDYLRANAETLRKGGSESSAEIYDEIASGIEGQEKDFADEQDAELEEARAKAVLAISETDVGDIENIGLMVVPSGWREASCQSDAK